MDLIEAIPSVLGAAAVVPPFLYLISLTLLDERIEPAFVVVACFLLGGLAVFLVEWSQFSVAGLAEPGIFTSFVQAVVETAAPEEAAKVLILLLFGRLYLAYDHPLEGIIYGAAVGLGFAAYENLALLSQSPGEWRDHMAIRNLLTVPVHGSLGIIAGVYVARACFGDTFLGYHDTAMQWRSYAWAWIVPTVLHGMFNFPLLVARNNIALVDDYVPALHLAGGAVAVLVVAICIRLLYRISATEDDVWAGRRPWALFGERSWRMDIVGFAAAFLGAMMLLIEVRDYLHGQPFMSTDRHMMTLLGATLLAAAVTYHRRAARQRPAAQSRR